MLEVLQLPVLTDNYIYVAHEPFADVYAVIDPAEAAPVQECLESRGAKLDFILNTHHHGDHVGGNLALKRHYACSIIGPDADAARIPGIDVALADGDEFALGETKGTVLDVPGHTRGHIAFWFRDDAVLFCGDTLFALGCGRLFEGTPAQMWRSLSKLRELPDETLVYCAHEYTQANAKFAVEIEPDNGLLQARYQDIAVARGHGEATVPSRLGLEKLTNPFLRPHVTGIRETLGMTGMDDEAIFAEIRRRKDSFRG